ncbi:RPH3A isoform 20 [Pongo abelii]|uniref:RPH3A isoform 20 n=1 Tax=Pongo abelii TaxID=9601 RepID=A0A2J8XKT0_PONAB|nr:RPH3A isoform 20 [Pongo abelii]
MTDTVFSNSSNRWMYPSDRPLQSKLQHSRWTLKDWLCFQVSVKSLKSTNCPSSVDGFSLH